MKQITLLLKILIIVLIPSHLFSQDLTGMWTGKIYTSDKTLPYEVAITQKDGKLSGYSYTTFMVKGEKMVAMKSIIVIRDKDSNVVIEDVDLVFNSFDEESPKQLKQTNVMQLEVNGKNMTLVGKFKTLKTKEFRSMGGGVRMRKDSIIEEPNLVAKLEEMDLSKSLSFLQPAPTTQTAVAKTEKPVVVEKENPVAVAVVPKPVSKPVAKPVPSKPVVTAAAKPPVASAPVAKAAVKTPVPVKPAPTTVTAATPPPVVAKSEPRVASKPLSAFMGNRSIENIQTLVFKSDSLLLTLYDNGEVDGDTVSILLNGKMIMSRVGLSTNAVTKTIYMTPDMGDSSQLIMYAETLGTIPPNTGLLIVKDGRDRYEIRFSGDLKKNAAIILKRKERD